MNAILIAVATVAGIGILAGLLLAVLSKVMAVPVDEKAQAIEEILPGANCGSCGFSGCSGYAAALSSGKTTETGLCNPGGSEVSAKIAEIMGLSAGEVVPMTAVVLCNGTTDAAERKMIYEGVESCKMAAQLFGGEKSCIYGCLGLGDCVQRCPYDAIKICGGVAVVDYELCRACGMCVATCPKKLIELIPKNKVSAAVLCKNHDKGVMTMKECKVGCIGCMKCVKACESAAVTVTANVAHVDPALCTACGKCAEGCPKHVIEMLGFGLTAEPVASRQS